MHEHVCLVSSPVFSCILMLLMGWGYYRNGACVHCHGAGVRGRSLGAAAVGKRGNYTCFMPCHTAALVRTPHVVMYMYFVRRAHVSRSVVVLSGLYFWAQPMRAVRVFLGGKSEHMLHLGVHTYTRKRVLVLAGLFLVPGGQREASQYKGSVSPVERRAGWRTTENFVQAGEVDSTASSQVSPWVIDSLCRATYPTCPMYNGIF